MNTSVVSENGSMSHPGRAARIEAVTRGFREAERRYPRTGGGGGDPAPSGSFVFADPFNDNSKEWLLNNDLNWKTTIENGKFLFSVLNPNHNYFSGRSLPIDTDRDFSASVTIRWQQGNQDNGHGLIYCGDYASNSMNIFQINANGYYIIRNWYRRGAWNNIVPWKRSERVNLNGAPNLLRVEKQGELLRFSINGHVVETLPFDGGYGNFFGLNVVFAKTVEFDNFRVEGIRKR